MKMQGLGNLFKNQRFISLLNACIGFLLVLAILFLIRDVISVSFTTREKGLDEKKAENGAKFTFQDYAPIFRNNPFGFPAGELKPISGSAASASSADVSLVGTVSGQRKFSYAIFMNKTGEQEIFRIGDSVFGLGKLNRVEKDRVFILSGGKIMEIPINDIVSVKEIQKGRGTEASSTGFTKKLSDSSYMVEQKKIQQAIENPKEIMTDARLLPNVVDGKQQGYILNEVRPGGIYQNLGLQNGDVLLRINEYNISHPENALQAFTALRGMERVQLDIMRNGSKMTMTYQIR